MRETTPIPLPQAAATSKVDSRLPVVGVVFSKDRPLQLDATLRSFRLQCRDAEGVTLKVLYTTSGTVQEAHYQTLRKEHPTVEFVRETDFASDLRRLIGEAEHILFLVDDAIFVGEFAMHEVTLALAAHPRALGISLRLGRNTTYCYPHDKPQRLPEFVEAGGLLRFDWAKGELDFNYPLEVSSSVYRVADLRTCLDSTTYSNPNELEVSLDRLKDSLRSSHPDLLCFEQSVAFCNPANVIQDLFANRFAGNPRWSVDSLLRLFALGFRIDFKSLAGFTPTGCHQEVPFAFLPPETDWDHIEASLTVTTRGEAPKATRLTCVLEKPRLSPEELAPLLSLLQMLGQLDVQRDKGPWLAKLSQLVEEDRVQLVRGADQTISRVKQRLAAADTEVRRQAEQAKSWETAANNRLAQVVGLEQRLTTADARANQWQTEASSLRQDLAASQTEAASLRQQLAASQTEAASLRQQLAASQTEVASLRQQLAASQTEVASLKQRLTAAEARATTAAEQVRQWKATADRLERQRWRNRIRSAWRRLWEVVSRREARKLAFEIDRPVRWRASLRELIIQGACLSKAGDAIEGIRVVVFGAFKRRARDADLAPAQTTFVPLHADLPAARCGFHVTARLCRGPNLVSLQARVRGRWVPFLRKAAWRTVRKTRRPSAAARTEEKPWPTDQPLVSVVVVVQDDVEALQATIHAIRAQTWKDCEVVVVDPGLEGCDTRRQLDSARTAGAAVLSLRHGSVAAARNLGVEQARGKHVGCLDAAALRDRTFLEQCVYRLETECLHSCGRIEPEMGASSKAMPVLFRKEFWKTAESVETVWQRLRGEHGSGKFTPCPTLGTASIVSGAWQRLARRSPRPTGVKSILVAKPFLTMGGAETIVGQILRHLAGEGFQITVITTEEAPPQFGSSRLLFEQSTGDLFELPRFLPAEQWLDFICYLIQSRSIGLLWQIGSNFTYEQLPAIHRQFNRIKVVDLLFNTVGHTGNNRKFAQWIDLHCVESAGVRDWLLAEGEPPERVALVPNGVDTERLQPRDRAEGIARVASDMAARFVVGFFGRLSQEKAPDAFVRIAAAFRNDSRFQFVMGGVGPMQHDVEARIRECALGERVRLLGVADIQKWIPSCDVVVVPSRLDGRPNVVLESLALGVPVLGSRVGGLPEMIRDGETGFLCAAEDIEGFAARIRLLADSPELASRMRVQARQSAVESFSITKTFSAYSELFRRLLTS